MLISQILSTKGEAVFTLSADDTLEQAARELNARKVGALVVVDRAGGVVGVLSERDIVREVALHGSGCLSQAVASAMSRGVITASPHESVEDGLDRMTDRRIRHLPVMDKGRLVGIVSIGDLVKHRIMAVEAEAAAMQAYIGAH